MLHTTQAIANVFFRGRLKYLQQIQTFKGRELREWPPTREETAVPPAREAEVRSQFSIGFLRVWGWGCRGGVRVGGEGRQIEKKE